ncbi:hypothetical protein [Corynebacterium heidelbergense]|uniref:Uncharacterized protein n=1 Tax=Corynebacterium heidelbergense TaxID=2055947 RepID=A0A364VC55_9CORY|nr:hypothetical protein [Corynebacterium heidelbergense]RAV34229.1 hypothetical protein CWC39_04305 [Corynebacterium heidelbergense]WCZ35777.1 hypothetical protein CHEID_00995 [Corynebacterium heidelbergense]
MTPRKRNWLQRMFGNPEQNSSHRSGESQPAHPGVHNEETGTPPEPDHLGDPHPVFTELTMRQAMAMEEQLRRSLEERGFAVEFEDYSVKFARSENQTRTMGLDNLPRLLAQLDDFDAEMPETVDEFVGNLVAAMDSPRLPDAEFYAAMRVRLAPMDQKGNEDFGKDSPLRPFSEDAFIRLVLDTEQSIQSLTTPALEDRGPVEDLYRMGYRNLWQELVDSDMSFSEYAPNKDNPDEKCWLLEGTNFFIGSAPLFLEELFERNAPHVDRSNGLIFAMPFRHVTIAREVTNGSDLMNSIGLMASLAAELYTTQPGAVSPRLHLMHMGEVETFTNVVWGQGNSRQAEIHIKPNAYLMGRISDGLDDGPEGPEGPVL